jgi:GntR family transcriptional regulator
MGLSIDAYMQVAAPLRRTVDIDAAGRLRLNSDVVYAITFKRIHLEVPICITKVFLPPHVAAHVVDTPERNEVGSTSSTTIIGLLDPLLDDPIAEADQSITVSRPQGRSGLPSCDGTTSLLRVDRVYFDTRLRAIGLAISHFLPEHYSYRVRLQRSAR